MSPGLSPVGGKKMGHTNVRSATRRRTMTTNPAMPGKPPDDLDARSRIAVHRRRFATRFPTETADDK